MTSTPVLSTPEAAASRTAHQLVVDGAAVRYTDNPGPAGSTRVPTVLVHGTGGTTATHFGFVEPMLATRGRVIAIDLAEPAGDALSLAQLVAQVGAVLDEAAAGAEVALLGYSLGAVVAAAVAAERPDTVTRLLLIGGWMRTDEQQRLRNEIWAGIDASAPELLGRYSTFCAFGPSYLQARTAAEVAALHRPEPASGFLRKQMLLNRDIDIVEEVESIRARTLVIGLTEDHMVPVHHSRQLFGAIDDARYAELPTGHAVVVERPAQLFALVDEFTGHPDRYPAASVIQPPKP